MSHQFLEGVKHISIQDSKVDGPNRCWVMLQTGQNDIYHSGHGPTVTDAFLAAVTAKVEWERAVK